MIRRRAFLQSASLGGLALGAGLTGSLWSRSAQAIPLPPRLILPENPRDPVRLPAGSNKSVLIIGGGLAGMSAALELAERGYQVTLREAGSVLGGRLATRRVKLPVGEFSIEHGLHMWFDNYHVCKEILARLGVNKYFRPYNQVHFQYRTYKPEIFESNPPRYPENMLKLIERSPNLGPLDALANLKTLADSMFYNHATNVSRFDSQTLRAWAKSRGVSNKFYDVVLQSAASVTLNDPEKISAAEMLEFMHLFFVGQPKAMNRQITTVDHHTAVIGPWEARLRYLGVRIELARPVKGLRFALDRALGEVGSSETFDQVVLATDVKGSQSVLAGSVALDSPAAVALADVKAKVGMMRVAPPYKILRVWLDKQPRAEVPDVLETPQHRPINLLAQYHLLEAESRDFAMRTGGSVLEFHLYANPLLSVVPDDALWPLVRIPALELMPELASAKLLARTVGSYSNFTSFEVGQASARPNSCYAAENGIGNLSLCGDWVGTPDYPTALMERAVVTGREAANSILLSDHVRQVPFWVTASHGPGLI